MFDEEIFKNWPDLNSLIEIKSTRMDLKTWIITEEKRYYISSLKACNAKKISNVIRNHWGIENNLHWQLDISFREDECRSRSGFSPQNFSQLRHISLKAEATKISIHRKRKMAGWNDEYLLKILLNDGKVS
jgi:predicted transposase YbfD/YdcC